MNSKQPKNSIDLPLSSFFESNILLIPLSVGESITEQDQTDVVLDGLDANGLYCFPHIQLAPSSAHGLVSLASNNCTTSYSSGLGGCTSYEDMSLWHYRLSHVNLQTVKNVCLCNINVGNKCTPQMYMMFRQITLNPLLCIC